MCKHKKIALKKKETCKQTISFVTNRYIKAVEQTDHDSGQEGRENI